MSRTNERRFIGEAHDPVEHWTVVEQAADRTGRRDTDCQWLVYNAPRSWAGKQLEITIKPVNGRRSGPCTE